MRTEHIRFWRRRKYRMMAAAASVAVISAGALSAANEGTDRTASTLDGRADVVATPDPSSPSATPGSPATAGSPKPSAPGSGGARRRVPPPVYPNVSVVPTVSESGSLKDRRTLRIVSAPGDLTGAHELRWVADGGHAVGNARCSQKFRFNATSAVTEKPTLLICWRTSATRSVYTVAVDLDGRPSETASVATIDKVWAGLG